MAVRETKPGVFFSEDAFPRFDDADIERLERIASAGESGKAVLCLHRSEGDRPQEMLYAFRRDVAYPAHKHLLGDESKMLLRGSAVLRLYDDDGCPLDSIRMTPPGGGGALLVRVPRGVHHYLDIESDVCVYYEIKPGPFEPSDNIMLATSGAHS